MNILAMTGQNCKETVVSKPVGVDTGSFKQIFQDMDDLFNLRNLIAKHGKGSQEVKSFIATLSQPMQEIASNVGRTADSLKETLGVYQQRLNYSDGFRLGGTATNQSKAASRLSEGFEAAVEQADELTTVAVGGSAATGKALGTLASMGLMVAASFAIDTIIQGIDELIVTTEEHREQLAGIKAEYDSIAASLDNVNARAEQTRVQMAEYEKGGVTEEEQPAYQKLVEENAEFIREQGVLGMDAQAKNLEAARQFVDTMESAYSGTALIEDEAATAAAQAAAKPGEFVPTRYKEVSQEEKQLHDIRLLEEARKERDRAYAEYQNTDAAETEAKALAYSSYENRLERYQALDDAIGARIAQDVEALNSIADRASLPEELQTSIEDYEKTIEKAQHEYRLAKYGNEYISVMLDALIEAEKGGEEFFEKEAETFAKLFGIEGADTGNGLAGFFKDVLKWANAGAEEYVRVAETLEKGGYFQFDKSVGRWSLPAATAAAKGKIPGTLGAKNRLFVDEMGNTYRDPRAGGSAAAAAGGTAAIAAAVTAAGAVSAATGTATTGGGRRSVLSRTFQKDVALAEAQLEALKSVQSYYREGSEDWLANQEDIVETFRGTARLMEQEYERLLKKGYTMADEEVRSLAGELLRVQESVYSESEALWNATRQKQIDTLQHAADQIGAVISLKEAHHGLLTDIRTETRELEKQYRLAGEQAANPGLTQAERDALMSAEDYRALREKLDGIAAEAERMYADYQQQIAAVSEDATEQLQFITAEYERQYALKLKQYETAKAELALTRAQKELENVRAERSVAMLVDGQWSWVADPEAMKRALENVADAEAALMDAQDEERHTAEIATLEAQKSGYESEIEALGALEFTLQELTGSVEALTAALREQAADRLSRSGAAAFTAAPGGEAAKLYSLARGQGALSAFATPESAALVASPTVEVARQGQQITYDNRVYIDGMELTADQSEALIQALRLAVPSFDPAF